MLSSVVIISSSKCIKVYGSGAIYLDFAGLGSELDLYMVITVVSIILSVDTVLRPRNCGHHSTLWWYTTQLQNVSFKIALPINHLEIYYNGQFTLFEIADESPWDIGTLMT